MEVIEYTKKERKELQKQVYDALATLRVSLWNKGLRGDVSVLDTALNKIKKVEERQDGRK